MSGSPNGGAARLHSKGAWAAASLRSGFGEQPLSNRSSAPVAGFGSSTRDAYGKQVRGRPRLPVALAAGQHVM